MSNMIKFIKLSNRAINISQIKRVDFDKVKYEYKIFMTDTHYKYNGFFMLGSGFIKGDNYDYIYANKEEHPESYKIIDDWYNSL